MHMDHGLHEDFSILAELIKHDNAWGNILDLGYDYHLSKDSALVNPTY